MKKRDKKDIDWEDYELYDIEDDEESSFDFKSIIDIFRKIGRASCRERV